MTKTEPRTIGIVTSRWSLSQLRRFLAVLLPYTYMIRIERRHQHAGLVILVVRISAAASSCGAALAVLDNPWVLLNIF